nr:immunoglobulin heavy chain junction region [Mus musculus]MBK4196253.1 immunoglobulin heavy chain junction region [Mus musculus]
CTPIYYGNYVGYAMDYW